MVIKALRVMRSTFRVMWLAGLVALIALVALPTALGLVSRQMYVVRGASMSPNIPLGAVVVTHAVAPSSIASGDVITFRLGTGGIVTHRVTGVSGGSEISFLTKGDASNSADPVPVPADAVVGRVEFDVPIIGLILAVLSSTSGMIVVLGLFGSLLIGGWFLDELAATLAPVGRRRSVADRAV